MVDADPGVRFYHYGDTALFTDLKLIAELYQPTIGCVGIANPLEILHRPMFEMPGSMLTAEMSPREGLLAAQWLGLETVLPCHYIGMDNPDLLEFHALHAQAVARGERVPKAITMKPGDTISWDGQAWALITKEA